MTDNKQSIGMTSIENARELGGYVSENGKTVRQGVLLRTAKLSEASAEDIRRLTEEYRVAKVIDFRSDEEINGYPEAASFTGTSGPSIDIVPGGAEYIRLPVLDTQRYMAEMMQKFMTNDGSAPDMFQIIGSLADSGLVGSEMYFGFVDNEQGKKSYSRFFRELLTLEEGRAVIFHCTQGKDRTGIASMLILSALGVSEETIVDDYMLTNVFNREKIAAEREMLERSGRVPPDKLDKFILALDCVESSTLTGLIARIKERYGSVMGYITGELGVTAEETEKLKERYLE